MAQLTWFSNSQSTQKSGTQTRISLCASVSVDVIECVVGPCALQLRRWEPPGLAPASTASTASLPSPLHRPSLPSRQSTSRCCSSRTVTPPAARTSHYPKSLACFSKEIFFCLFSCCYSPPTGMMARSRTAVSASLSKALSHTVADLGSCDSYDSVCFCFPRQL